MADDQTITVSDSAIPGQLGAAARQALLLVGGWAVGKGYLDSNTLAMLGTLATIVVPIAYGQWRRYQDHAEKRELAIAAPNGVVK